MNDFRSKPEKSTNENEQGVDNEIGHFLLKSNRKCPIFFLKKHCVCYSNAML